MLFGSICKTNIFTPLTAPRNVADLVEKRQLKRKVTSLSATGNGEIVLHLRPSRQGNAVKFYPSWCREDEQRGLITLPFEPYELPRVGRAQKVLEKQI